MLINFLHFRPLTAEFMGRYFEISNITLSIIDIIIMFSRNFLPGWKMLLLHFSDNKLEKFLSKTYPISQNCIFPFRTRAPRPFSILLSKTFNFYQNVNFYQKTSQNRIFPYRTRALRLFSHFVRRVFCYSNLEMNRKI